MLGSIDVHVLVCGQDARSAIVMLVPQKEIPADLLQACCPFRWKGLGDVQKKLLEQRARQWAMKKACCVQLLVDPPCNSLGGEWGWPAWGCIQVRSMKVTSCISRCLLFALPYNCPGT